MYWTKIIDETLSETCNFWAEWSSEEVATWCREIASLPEDVATAFRGKFCAQSVNANIFAPPFVFILSAEAMEKDCKLNYIAKC